MSTGELPTERGDPIVEATVVRPRVARLSIVIPAKNEAANLPKLLDELSLTLRTLPATRSEIIVVDDGSSDDTAAIALARGARLVRHARSLGNGAAIKRGIREAAGDWILLMDGDGQHPPNVIPRLIARAAEHDMVVASRGGSGGSHARNLANKVYNGLASYVTSRRIPDLTSGFRLVRADVLKGLVYLLPNTFSYPTTITLAMLRAGYSVDFEPFQVRQREGKSHIKLIEDGTRFLLIIMRITTIFAPLRVFVPLAAFMAAIGAGWYVWTYLTAGRFTNMSALLLSQATIVFVLGLISEQVTALRYARIDEGNRR
ncbi:MAG: glycosyltransferase family 2 protein [Planctomycetes bacterium]|nr:glycosyltransferase family 2 protein [Planctomycetota bacterium]